MSEAYRETASAVTDLVGMHVAFVEVERGALPKPRTARYSDLREDQPALTFLSVIARLGGRSSNHGPSRWQSLVAPVPRGLLDCPAKPVNDTQ
jgi:hypothetical protein